MTLSLEAIHQPLNDFFLNAFKTNADDLIVFRFDKFGSIISEEDFINPSHPEFGFVPALVTEKFSDLVNHIPVDLGDGLNIQLSLNSIDDTYFFRLLSPSLPFVSANTSSEVQQQIISTFSSLKQTAQNAWNDITLESSTGLKLKFKPSLATPENWFDSSKNEVWTSQSFQVSEKSSTSASYSPGQLWKLKLSDQLMTKILQLPEQGPTLPDPPPFNIADRVLALRANPNNMITPGVFRGEMDLQPDFSPTFAPTQHFVSPGRVNPVLVNGPDDLSTNIDVSVPDSVTLHDRYLKQYNALDLSKRLVVTQYLDTNAPRQAVETSSISISFDYCVVNIRRPWYSEVFITDKSWCTPSVSKGQFTSNGPAGNLPLMPVGFVAIRNLKIEANWTGEDIKNASQATDFGPFKVTTNIIDNTLSHPGLQIIGWFLQKMPDLPPNYFPV